MNHRSARATGAIAGLLLALAAPVGAASFTGLGDIPGGPVDSVANAVSDDGQVVAGTGHYGPNSIQAFRWTAETGLQGLPGVPGMLLANDALALSRDGRFVVGYTYNLFLNYYSEWLPARWDAGGNLEILQGFGGTGYAIPVATSGDGSVVVGTGLDGTAFRWTAETGAVSLGDLPGGSQQSAGRAVSADGSVVVGQGSPDNYWEPAAWTEATGMFSLGSLGGGPYGAAWGVSPEGSVIVGVSPSPNGPEAFRWTSAGGMVGLGMLPGGSVSSTALAASAGGARIVGYAYGATAGFEETDAFIWTEQDGMQLLADVLLAGGATGLEGWTLRRATAISADGQWVVGWGVNPTGGHEAFRAQLTVVPLPGTAVLVMSALGLLATGARRRLPGHSSRSNP